MSSGAGDNYEAVDMEESSDESGSDNEAFATKQEYKAYKEQFKVSKGQTGGAGGSKIEDEYGGRGSSEYGGGGSLPGLNRGQNEFGGGHPGYQGDQGGRHDSGRRDEYNRESGDSSKHRDERGGGGRRGESGRDRDDHGARRGHHDGGRDRRRSRSREDNRRRSRDKDDNKRRSRDRDEKRRSKSRERRRSRSRSRERRDSEDRAGGWRSWNEKRGGGRGGRDRDRRGGGYEERQRRREEREQEREEQVRKAEEMGVEIPKYFKPGGVQPVSYAEQVLKRKMLWSKPAAAQQPDSAGVEAQPAASSQQAQPQQQQQPVKTSWNKWETTNFGDGEKNEKFRRLMGIKSKEPAKVVPVAAAPSAVLSPEEQKRMQSDLETNYEVARQQTHRNKGLGLGFTSAEPYSAPPPPQGGLVLGGFVPKNH